MPTTCMRAVSGPCSNGADSNMHTRSSHRVIKAHRLQLRLCSSPEKTVMTSRGGNNGSPSTAEPPARWPGRRSTLSAGMKRTLSRTVSGTNLCLNIGAVHEPACPPWRGTDRAF